MGRVVLAQRRDRLRHLGHEGAVDGVAARLVQAQDAQPSLFFDADAHADLLAGAGSYHRARSKLPPRDRLSARRRPRGSRRHLPPRAAPRAEERRPPQTRIAVGADDHEARRGLAVRAQPFEQAALVAVGVVEDEVEVGGPVAQGLVVPRVEVVAAGDAQARRGPLSPVESVQAEASLRGQRLVALQAGEAQP